MFKKRLNLMVFLLVLGMIASEKQLFNSKDFCIITTREICSLKYKIYCGNKICSNSFKSCHLYRRIDDILPHTINNADVNRITLSANTKYEKLKEEYFLPIFRVLNSIASCSRPNRTQT